MLPIYLIGLALFLAFLHGLYLYFKGRRIFPEALFLMYLLFCNVGIMGFLAFYSHTALRDKTAELIGWPASNPFQLEVAAANLAFGVLGFLSLWIRTLSFWFATLIGNTSFLIGCLIVHLIQYAKGNYAPYNIGPFIWVMDLFIPLLLIGIFFLTYRKKDQMEKLS